MSKLNLAISTLFKFLSLITFWSAAGCGFIALKSGIFERGWSSFVLIIGEGFRRIKLHETDIIDTTISYTVLTALLLLFSIAASSLATSYKEN